MAPDALRRRGAAVSYFRSESGFEVDFIVRGHDGQVQAIQVSESLAHPDTRHRELRALEALMRERGLGQATVVTLEHEERIELGAGQVQAIPAWRWLLRSD